MLKKIPVKVNTPEWLELKRGFIGCSEVSILTGESDFSSPIVLFYQKIGLHPVGMEETPLLFWGHQHEPLILDTWEYYEPGENQYIKNLRAGKRVRTCRRNEGYILVNEDYPFISYTPDGIIPEGQMSLYGERLTHDSPLQAKNTNSLVWNMYDGLIPYQLEQVNTEMLVLGSGYGEIATLVGGNQFEVQVVPRSEAVQNGIIKVCFEFWNNHVTPALPLAYRHKMATSNKEKEAIMKDIMALEPPPDASEHYRQFLTTRFQNRTNPDKKIQASETMEKLMNIYQRYADIEKALKNKKTLIKNTLLKIHEHNGISVIQGKAGKSSLNKKHLVTGKELTSQEIKQIVNNLN